MANKRSANKISGMNPKKGPDFGANFQEEFANEPLTVKQKQHNKKKKKNQ